TKPIGKEGDKTASLPGLGSSIHPKLLYLQCPSQGHFVFQYDSGQGQIFYSVHRGKGTAKAGGGAWRGNQRGLSGENAYFDRRDERSIYVPGGLVTAH